MDDNANRWGRYFQQVKIQLNLQQNKGCGGCKPDNRRTWTQS